ncbi:hypothetical protein F4861DRAFT_544625 [Xylaria intraflava]|nr:hypothetical protein F4861DRAFT_544625 [Xylaria intraflava]
MADPVPPPLPDNNTAWEVVFNTYAVVRARWAVKPVAPSLNPLLDRPAVRALHYHPESARRCDFNVPGGASSANRNLKAALQQVVGVAAAPGQGCTRCGAGTNPWDVCVVIPGKPYCAGCAYNGAEKKCSRK